MKITRTLVTLAAVGVLTAPTAEAAPRLSGMQGLTPSASALQGYISNTYAPPAIGGVRPDRLPDHPSGHALDVMVYGNTALGNAVYADVCGNKAAHGVRYCLWQVANHYDHVHVTVY